MFDKPGVYYSNNPFTIFDSEWLLDFEKIEGLKQHQLSVLDFSSEHYGVNGLDHVYHALENSKVNFLLLIHDPSDHKKFDRMLFYPHWYHWSRKNFVVGNQSKDCKYKWGCLNGNPRAHRIYNYFYSKQQSYFESACFTFYNAKIYRNDDVELPPEVVDFWEKNKNTLTHKNIGIDHGITAGARCDLPALTDSYVHLVTETTVIPKIFISEKTWKPVAAGQLFLVFGNPGTVNYLRDQGVDVFDDIIDHGYDTVRDWKLRLHQIHQQLEKLISCDLKELYTNTESRRQSNSEKFFSGQFDKQYLSTITQCINMPS